MLFIVLQENTPTREEDILKEHLNELREKLRTMHLQQEDEIDHYKQREENLRKTMLILQDKHKHEVRNSYIFSSFVRYCYHTSSDHCPSMQMCIINLSKRHLQEHYPIEFDLLWSEHPDNYRDYVCSKFFSNTFALNTICKL